MNRNYREILTYFQVPLMIFKVMITYVLKIYKKITQLFVCFNMSRLVDVFISDIHCITSVSDAAESLVNPEREKVRESAWPLLSVSVSVLSFCSCSCDS